MSTNESNGKNGNGYARQLAIGVGSFLIAGLLAWTGLGIVDLQGSQREIRTEMRIRMEHIEDKAREIVPREENEKRYGAIEKGQGINEERITRIEQMLYTYCGVGPNKNAKEDK